eukprot:g25304.t1
MSLRWAHLYPTRVRAGPTCTRHESALGPLVPDMSLCWAHFYPLPNGPTVFTPSDNLQEAGSVWPEDPIRVDHEWLVHQKLVGQHFACLT